MNTKEIRLAFAQALVGAHLELRMVGSEEAVSYEVVGRVATLGRKGDSVLALRGADGSEISLSRRGQEAQIDSMVITTPIVRESASPATKAPSKKDLAAEVARLTAENMSLREQLAAFQPVAATVAEVAEMPAEATAEAV